MEEGDGAGCCALVIVGVDEDEMDWRTTLLLCERQFNPTLSMSWKSDHGW